MDWRRYVHEEGNTGKVQIIGSVFLVLCLFSWMFYGLWDKDEDPELESWDFRIDKFPEPDVYISGDLEVDSICDFEGFVYADTLFVREIIHIGGDSIQRK